MQTGDYINQSLEQSVEALGDPADKVFALMYQRFPELLAFKEENPEWEDYMFNEIMTNFMSLADDQDTALLTIREMAVHHELIGVSPDIFKGMYTALYEVMSDTFHGPEKDNMLAAWQEHLNKIKGTIESVV